MRRATTSLPSSCRNRSTSNWGRWTAAIARTAALAVVMLCASSAVAYAQGKLAVIDLRRAVIETEDGLRVQSKLKQLFDNRQTDLDGKQKSFQQAKADLDKEAKRGKLSKRELQNRADKLQKQAMELQGALTRYQREMQQQENELTTPIVTRMMTLIRRVAAQNSYDMVLDRSAVPYFRSDLDITDRLIQMYNAGPAGSGAKKPAPKKGKRAPKRPKKR